MDSTLVNIISLLKETEDKLTHLEHPEDHYLNAGPEGFKHAINTLVRTHNSIVKNKKQVTTTTKKDGSPSVVFGRHPETGKFFVATKSAFNKTPKLNYNDEDIERNHGHAPGLVDKMKKALKHLPKITPKKGVFQGDLMFDKDDVHTDDTHHRFTPNTITYGVRKDSNLGEKVRRAKLGIYVHTHYEGDSFPTLKAKYNKGNEGLHEHPDVMTDFGKSKTHYNNKRQRHFARHIQKAIHAYRSLTPEDHKHLSNHSAHLKIYINKTIRDDTSPTSKGYAEFLRERGEKEKSQSAKNRTLSASLHAKRNSSTFTKFFRKHNAMQEAKHAIVDALSHDHDLEHHVDGTPTKPEGHVVSINNRPSKLNRRREFNRLNSLKNNR